MAVALIGARTASSAHSVGGPREMAVALIGARTASSACCVGGLRQMAVASLRRRRGDGACLVGVVGADDRGDELVADHILIVEVDEAETGHALEDRLNFDEARV